MSAAINPSRFDQLGMNGGSDVLPHPEDAEGIDHGGYDQRFVAVDPVRLGHDDVLWKHAQLGWHKHRGNDKDKQRLLQREFILGKSVTRQRTEEHNGQCNG